MAGMQFLSGSKLVKAHQECVSIRREGVQLTGSSAWIGIEALFVGKKDARSPDTKQIFGKVL